MVSSDTKTTIVVGPLSGLSFVVELDILSLKKKKELQDTITQNGGSLDFAPTKKTTHVVTIAQLLDSFRIQSAINFGCLVVTEEFIAECLKQGVRVDERPYLYIESQRANDFDGGSQRKGNSTSVKNDRDIALRDPKSLLSKTTSNIQHTSTSPRANSLVLNSKRSIKLLALGNIAAVSLSAPIPKNKPEVLHTQKVTESPSSTSIISRNQPRQPTLNLLSSSVRVLTSSPRAFRSSYSSTDPSSVGRPLTLSVSVTQPIKPAAAASAAAKAPSFTALLTQKRKCAEQARKEQKMAEAKARLEAARNMIKERQVKRQQREDERKKVKDEQKLDRLGQRSKDEEERKQRVSVVREEREKRIAAERKEREEMLENLKQKPRTHFVDYFSKIDEEEERKRIEEDEKWLARETEKQRKKEEKRERNRIEEKEKRLAAKEAKRRRRDEEESRAKEDKQKAKLMRREKYPSRFYGVIEDARKQKEEAQRKQKSVHDFQERQRKRELKMRLGVAELPNEKGDYDTRKISLVTGVVMIFVGGIKLDDLTPEALGGKYSSILDIRINNLLHIFDRFGKVIKRKVFLEQKHFFITYETAEMAKEAMKTMQDFEERKTAVEPITVAVKKKKGNLLTVPHPSFYVREPNVKKKKAKPVEVKPKVVAVVDKIVPPKISSNQRNVKGDRDSSSAKSNKVSKDGWTLVG